MARKKLLSCFALGLLSAGLGCQTLVIETSEPLSPTSVGRIDPRPYGKWFTAYRLENPALFVIIVPDTGRIHVIARPGSTNLLWESENMGYLLTESKQEQTDPGGLSFVTNLPPNVIWHAKAWINEDGSRICHLQTRIADDDKLVHSVLISLSANKPVLTATHRMTRVGYSKEPERFMLACHLSNERLHVIPADAGLKGHLSMARQVNCNDTILFSDMPAETPEDILLPEPWFATFAGETGLSIRAQTSRTETTSLRSQAQKGLNRTVLLTEAYPLSPGQSLQMTYTIRLHNAVTWPDPCDSARIIAAEVRK